MWRYSFLNFCFVIAVIILVAIQHSGQAVAPAGHDETANGDRLGEYASDSDLSLHLDAAANLSRAATFVSDTWNRSMVIKQWWMEYNTSQWESSNAKSPAENDLLEARFHVANAEAFRAAMSENYRANRELARAEQSLQAAQTIVEAGLAPRLTTIREEITAAETKEQDASSTAPFEMIKMNLDHLIERVRAS